VTAPAAGLLSKDKGPEGTGDSAAFMAYFSKTSDDEEEPERVVPV
jgi:hypothetical protein